MQEPSRLRQAPQKTTGQCWLHPAFFIPCLSTSGPSLCILFSQAAESTELCFNFAYKWFIFTLPLFPGNLALLTALRSLMSFFFFLEFKSNNNYRKGPARLFQMNEVPLKKAVGKNEIKISSATMPTPPVVSNQQYELSV